MTQELRERVAEAMWQAESLRAVGQRRVIKWSDAGPPTWDQWLPLADAAIAIIRGETLEEAARVAEDCAPVSQDTFSMELAERCDMVAAAIRALKDKQ